MFFYKKFIVHLSYSYPSQYFFINNHFLGTFFIGLNFNQFFIKYYGFKRSPL